ncbi:MAG: hypothetical protein NC102_03785 [Clostridium sp.]|nr:hypothetical protein [Clostridium sp.]
MDINKFQWKRVGMLFKLYYPVLHWQIIIYFILSLAMTGLMALGNHYGHVLFPMTVCGLVMSLAYYLAPISITRRDYRHVCAALPATATEKLVFLLLYFGVGMYLVIYGPNYILQYLFPDAVPSAQSITARYGMEGDLGIDFGWWTYPYQFFNAFAIVPVTLWAMVVSKTNRAAMIFAAYIVATIAESMIGGMVGFVWALTHLDEMTSPEDIYKVGDLIEYVFILGTLMAVAIVSVFLPLLYKKLKRCGF